MWVVIQGCLAVVLLNFVGTSDKQSEHIVLNSSHKMLIGVDRENLLKKSWLDRIKRFLIDDMFALCQM